MEISFGGSAPQRVCESERELRRAYDVECARKLMLRLTELRAAPSLDDVRSLGGDCRELDGNRAGQLAVELSDGVQLIFTPLGGWPSSHRRGRGWKAVEAIQVVEISICNDDEG